MKISVIIPTYNDAETIEETLESIFKQSYSNYEIIIVNDGSTDNTEEVLEKYINNKKIKYYSQENKDQLNAIIHGMKFITGDIVFILHSDDTIGNDKIFEKIINEFKEENIDAIIGNLTIVNSKGEITGKQITKKYCINNNQIPMMLLWLGRNIYCDTAFFKTDIFKTKVLNNYLKWNTPFWIDLNQKPKQLNVKNVDYSLINYRVFENNYINNELGRLNVINGELRTAISLMNYYNIPFYKLQYIIYRIFNKLNIKYKVIYKNKEIKNKYEIIKFIISKRFNENEIRNNIFLNNLLSFYKNKKIRTIKIENIEGEILFGNSMRIFNKKILNNEEIDGTLGFLLKEMKQGFNKIILNNINQIEDLKNILKFLCIYGIEIEGDNK